MSQDDLISRLSVKSQEHIFLDELENSFELSPKEARGILDSAKTVFNLEGVSHPGNIRPGQIREIVLTKDASTGKPLSQLKKVEIALTSDAGEEDLDVLSKYRRVALREARILRLMEEALDQEGILTQEDLSRILKVDVRTIKRDIAHLRKQGYIVHTRGQIKGIGRGKSHKVAILSFTSKDILIPRSPGEPDILPLLSKGTLPPSPE